MYKYLFNQSSTTPLDDTWKGKITDALEKHHIGAPLESWGNEEDLSKQLEQTSKTTTNTLVVIGNDHDFAMLVGVLNNLDTTVAIGYVPLDGGSIGQRLQHKSWESAIAALAHRRIHETKLISVGKRYFLDNISLQIEPTDNSQPIIITADSHLHLRLPDSRLNFENLSDDQYLAKPVFFTAESMHQHEKTDKNDLLGGLRKKLKITPSAQKQLNASLHGKVFHIESASIITDSLGRSYKNSLWVGKTSRPIRLITSRQSQPS